MAFIRTISPWINIIGIVLVIDGILLLRKKKTPKYAQERLTGTKLKAWRTNRFAAHMILAAGFYLNTISKNLPPAAAGLIINLAGLLLIFTGLILSIRNNISKIGKWSAII